MSKLSPNAKKWLVIGIIISAIVIPLTVWGITSYRQKPQGERHEASLSEPYEEEPEIITEPVSEDAITILFCGLDDSAGLTDVISLISFDVKADKINVLQIPRDTYIGDNYNTGKINQVYFAHHNDEEPIMGLINVLNEQMSLEIDYYIVITLQNFRSIINSIGGVTVNIPNRIEFLPGKVIEAGEQHLTGEQAEWFVRYRAGYRLGDIGRINAQELMINALIQKVHDLGRREMLKLAAKNFKNITTNLSINKSLSLANEAFLIKNDNIQSFLLEGTGKTHKGYAVYEVHKTAITELLNLHFRPYSQRKEYISFAQIPPPPPPSSTTEDEITQDIDDTETPEDIINDFPID